MGRDRRPREGLVDHFLDAISRRAGGCRRRAAAGREARAAVRRRATAPAPAAAARASGRHRGPCGTGGSRPGPRGPGARGCRASPPPGRCDRSAAARPPRGAGPRHARHPRRRRSRARSSPSRVVDDRRSIMEPALYAWRCLARKTRMRRRMSARTAGSVPPNPCAPPGTVMSSCSTPLRASSRSISSDCS